MTHDLDTVFVRFGALSITPGWRDTCLWFLLIGAELPIIAVSMIPTLTLKPGRERSVHLRHPWLFSGAFQELPRDVEPGSFVYIQDSAKTHCGTGIYHPSTSLAVRLFTTSRPADPISHFLDQLRHALSIRVKHFAQNTTGYRLVNAEGDALPGLILDRFGSVVVLQSGIKGTERIKSQIVEVLRELLPLDGIIERSSSSSRTHEGLSDSIGTLFGVVPEEVAFLEEDIHYLAHPHDGQKTGFFLDQRESRSWVRRNAAHRRVLNLFSFSGGFSLAAIAGGADSCTSVDSSQKVLDILKKQIELNQQSEAVHNAVCADVFDYVSEMKADYDLVICDPPALIQDRAHHDRGIKAYRSLNRRIMEKMASGSILCTFSCSTFCLAEEFERLLMEAATSAHRTVAIIGRHGESFDHPRALSHPEGAYLKGLYLRIL